MAMLKLFKSRIPSCQYFFKGGAVAHFISGRFQTDNEEQIEELEKEVAANHPHIYVDAKEKEVDSEALDPIEFIKKKAIEEYIAAQAAKEGTDFGNTSAEAKDGIMTTADTTESAKLSIKVGAK